jgi:GNAT superfamily N-acetyltransferase
MFDIRLATEEDAATIARHRRLMFAVSFEQKEEEREAVERAFTEWVRPKLRDGSYVGWLAEEADKVIAGAGLYILDFPPHWMDVKAERGYLLNFYTEPEARGRGIAKTLLRMGVEECKRREIRVVVLHASKFGRPVYERFGFKDNNEMILRTMDEAQGWQ